MSPTEIELLFGRVFLGQCKSLAEKMGAFE